MENEIVKADVTKSNLPEINYNKEQLELIKNMFAKGADDNEFQLLVYMSKKYRLDILTKQIWCVKYPNQPAQIYSGRDGFLEIAQGYPVFDGMDTILQIVHEPFLISYYDKEERKQKSFGRDFQYVATCSVYRKDRSHPITVTVYESEYSTGRNLWITKPRTMIQKVAESQCLRKSFSISGIYSPEEMGQWEAEQNGKFTVTQEAPKISIVEAPITQSTVAPITTEPKYPSNRKYFEEYDWTKVDMQAQPKPQSWKANPKDPTKKIPDKPAIELVKLYFYACQLMPKEEVGKFYESITGKKYGYTYEHIKLIANALMAMEDENNKSVDEDIEIIDEEEFKKFQDAFLKEGEK